MQRKQTQTLTHTAFSSHLVSENFPWACFLNGIIYGMKNLTHFANHTWICGRMRLWARTKMAVGCLRSHSVAFAQGHLAKLSSSHMPVDFLWDFTIIPTCVWLLGETQNSQSTGNIFVWLRLIADSRFLFKEWQLVCIACLLNFWTQIKLVAENPWLKRFLGTH